MTRIWRILPGELEILKISTLTGFSCAKYTTFNLKKYRGVIFHDTELELSFRTLKSDAKIWRKTDLWFGKMTWEIWQIYTRALESLKIGTLMGSFYTKYKMYELKIYRGVMFHDNKEWCKIWREIDLSFQNWLEEFDKFWFEHLRVWKIWTLIGSFYPK